ncbi:MAG: DUF1015 domain-containing protein [Firmicutes bacterium]|nr:DUF1015 domain-containing protein [Bacillota bacterium]
MKLPIMWDKILLPKINVDLSKWAVVACDQYTSNPEYWEKLDTQVGDNPSTLRLILPEVFLGKDDETRSKKIAAAMGEYVKGGIFDTVDDGVIVVERTTVSNGSTKKRKGIMLVVDLDAYSFKHEDKALIRATEGTVIERLPPRAAVRAKCGLELPHIMLLVDDPKRTLIEPLVKAKGKELYKTELNSGGGKISGKLVDGCKQAESALEKLLADSIKKYGEPLLFGVGDGNHSLAAAKMVYEQSGNPKSKYALVEVVNIYDEGLEFEPIHRLIIGTKSKALVDVLVAKLGVDTGAKAKHNLMCGKQKISLKFPSDAIEAVAKVQDILDDFVTHNGGEIDYIHGEGDLEELCAKDSNSVGILLPPMSKDALFEYVVKKGALPRKTFSMGEAYEKRYYLEAREIR